MNSSTQQESYLSDILTSDFECTTFSKGNVYDLRNKAVCVSMKRNEDTSECLFSFPKEQLQAKLFVFFNAKYDLSWWRKLGQDISNWTIWCCQLAEFVLEGQTNRYPSLEQTAIKYGLGHKLDVVKLEYWDKGINTDEIPPEVLSEYACQDTDLTYKVYQRQLAQFKERPKLFKLFKLMCQDLLVLQEMEWNGIKYNKQLCKERSTQIEAQLSTLQAQLSSVYPDVPINFNSGDQLSAFLYGGTIDEETKEHIGFFKTGQKAGQPKYKNVVKEHVLPRLVEPLPKSELKKEGVYKTDEPTLRKLKGKAAKAFVQPLLDVARLSKLKSTYYDGIPLLAEDSHWQDNFIYGSFNQVVAATGRLSSVKPNLQNMAGEFQDCLISRYDT